MQRPRCRETRERNRAGHTLPAPGMGDVRPWKELQKRAIFGFFQLIQAVEMTPD